MRCKFPGCLAALVLVGFVTSAGTAAAKPRSKGKAKVAAKAAAAPAPEKKKAAELMTDDRAISKQMSWEDKVLGPNDKKAELAKIARASAITKAAAEKAAADKAAGLDVKEPPAQAAPKGQAKSALNLPALPDEEELKGNGARDKRREISPKLATEQAAAPVPAAKPADDKFIDKLLNSDGPVKKKSAAKTSDSALVELLEKETDKPAPKAKGRGKADVVDSLLATADKEEEKTVVQPKQPDWTKPDLPSAPVAPPPPVAAKPAPRKNTGVIQVIQGANYAPPPSAAAAVSPRKVAPSEPASPARVVAARPAGWKDPFADGAAQGRKPAAPTPPSVKKETAAHPPGWRDPFADDNKAKRAAPSEGKRTNGETPAAPAGKSDQWKDPFTENSGGARATVAVADAPQRKWDIAARRAAKPAAPAAAAEPASRWGVLKKRVH